MLDEQNRARGKCKICAGIGPGIEVLAGRVETRSYIGFEKLPANGRGQGETGHEMTDG